MITRTVAIALEESRTWLCRWDAVTFVGSQTQGPFPDDFFKTLALPFTERMRQPHQPTQFIGSVFSIRSRKLV
jgi:hypothetical protein